MIEKSTIDIVAGAFFDQPTKEFYLRELSRLTKKSMPTIISTTNTLAKKGVINKKKERALTFVQAKRDSPAYLAYKRLDNLRRIYESGLIESLKRTFQHPKAIILYGSYSRGEDVEKSDVDVAVMTSRRLRPDLSSFEKKIGRPIHLITWEDPDPTIKVNLMNGIVLEGSW